MIQLPKDLGVCVLRNFTADDAVASAELEYDPEVKKFVGDGKMKSPIEHYIEHFSENLDRMGYAIEAPDGRFIGRTSLDRSLVVREPSITIVLAKDCQGKGIGAAIAACLLSDWFNDSRAIAVRAEIHRENIPSQKLVRSLGFTSIEETNHIGHDIFRLDRAAYESRKKSI